MTNMNYKFLFPKIPEGTVLGINFSGMHDTAIALVSQEGTPIFSVSLERLSRVKQDGRHPDSLLEALPWERISKVALSVERKYISPGEFSSRFHPIPLATPLEYDCSHAPTFLQALDFIPCEKIFVPHHLCHAASAFWLSGFSNATCLVYDGGMSNEEWFGGVFDASVKDGIVPVDQFSAHNYSNVTRLYTAVTVILGFRPLKHEGKITGLAACGTATNNCRKILEEWLVAPELLNDLMGWRNMYSRSLAPQLKVNPSAVQQLREKLIQFTREDIAATVQEITEEHIINILTGVIKQGVAAENICLSGGIFTNVKINQRISEMDFKSTFISPPMSDDGTALGAALQVASEISGFSPKPIRSMFLGPNYSRRKVNGVITKNKIVSHKSRASSREVAEFLADGLIVAIYRGAMEFGPRALGNRSILANANDPAINQLLNSRLSRTEFMPFAPICLMEDAERLFHNVKRVKHAAEFMTVTLDCSNEMKSLCPAVVHRDGTARPQLITRQSNAFIYKIISDYKEISGKPALVNTSFNVHEEPIVCTPEDAIKSFFESGLDVLFLEGHIIKLYENKEVEAVYLRKKLGIEKIKMQELESSLQQAEQHQQNLTLRLDELQAESIQHEHVIQQKEDVIHRVSGELAATHLQIDELNHSKERLSQEIEDVYARKAVAEAVKEQLKETIQSKEEQAEAQSRQIEELTETLSNVREQKAAAEAVKEQLQQIIETKEEQAQAQSHQTEELTEALNNVREQKAAAEAVKEQLQKTIQLKEQQAEAQSHQTAELTETLSSVREQKAAAESVKKQLQHTAQTLEQRLSIQTEKINQLIIETNEQQEQAKAHAQWLQNEWDAAKMKIDELNHSSHHWWLESERLNKELKSVYQSKSWLISWPLRKLMQFLKGLFFLPIMMVVWIFRLPKRIVRWIVVELMAYISKRPNLIKKGLNFLKNYPKIKVKLRALALAKGIMQKSHKLENTVVPVTLKAETRVANINSEPDLSSLTPQARRIYSDLKKAIEKNKEEN